jgi:alpha-tubulin suppressor-like RCC1 family protein
VTVAQEVAAVTVTPATATITALGETVQLAATAQDANGFAVGAAEFAWTSSDESIASVSASGLVTAVANGTASITATAGQVSGVAAVTVNEADLAILTTSLADGVVGTPYSETLTASGGDGSYTWSVSTGTLPVGLTLTSGGTISGTPTAEGTKTFTVEVASHGLTATRELTITIAEMPLSITTTSIPPFMAGKYSSFTLEAAGRPSYTLEWTIVDGVLPTGLSLSRYGRIAGIPESQGTSSVVVRVTSGASSAEGTFEIIVLPELRVVETTIGTLMVNEPVSIVLAAEGGDGSYTWSVSPYSRLPDGLSLSAGGVIAGVPTTAGTAFSSVTVSSAGFDASRTFSLRVLPELVIPDQVLPAGRQWEWYSEKIIAIGGDGSFEWSLVPNSTPPGMIVDEATFSIPRDASLMGFSTSAGQYNVLVGVTSAGRSVTKAIPVTIEPPSTFAGWKKVSIGSWHVCAVTVANEVYCWGDGALGGLGAGTVETWPFPIAVRGSLRASGVSAGTLYSCAIADDGRPHCWGPSSGGRLGTDLTGDYFCWAGSGYVPCFIRPVPAKGNLLLESIAASARVTCGVTATSTAYCWGSNTFGELGIGRTGTWESIPVALAGTWTQLDPGDGWHACGISSDGEVRCWGKNQQGQLGRGTGGEYGDASSTPAPVQSAETFVTVASGYEFSCGLTNTGAVYCWGVDDNGVLGVEVGPDQCYYNQCSKQPMRVELGFSATHLVAGHNHVCVLDSSGAAHCWGHNFSGELGRGTTEYSSHIPQEVSGGLTFVQLAAGRSVTCGVTSLGELYCWGAGSFGQMGNNTATTANRTPVRVFDPY